MLKQKRGLSDVITTALIILLAIAAVVIVWSFVRPTLQKAGEQIDASCATVDMSAISCVSATTDVVVRNGPGQGQITAGKLVYYDASGNSQSIDIPAGCLPFNPLDQKTCTPAAPVDMNGAAAGTGVTQAAVAAVINGRTCPVTSTRATCS